MIKWTVRRMIHRIESTVKSMIKFAAAMMTKLLTWLTIAVIAVLAVPVVIFLALISIIWTCTGKLINRLEGIR